MKSRKTLSAGSFSTGISTLNTLTLSAQNVLEPQSSEVKMISPMITKPKNKTHRLKSKRKKSSHKKKNAHSVKKKHRKVRGKSRKKSKRKNVK